MASKRPLENLGMAPHNPRRPSPTTEHPQEDEAPDIQRNDQPEESKQKSSLRMISQYDLLLSLKDPKEYDKRGYPRDPTMI
nr:hypothetical protein [Candidatus Njordarchaeota archaeon]